MTTRRSLILSALSAAVAPAAMAQHTGMEPRYGTISLAPGFMPDPHVIRVQAGGNVNLGSMFRGCVGWVDNRPDMNLVWSGGSNLFISVRSSTDTVLLVNCANARWHCDDDTIGHNPVVRFRHASRGRYNIWVGTYGREPVWVDLRVSEISA